MLKKSSIKKLYARIFLRIITEMIGELKILR